ncbi:MAG TPA: DUF58 domain-containing protein [Firmicutes bacterium]|nr:DUF58 domain-containing protein [Bacillota bacterium]
MMTLLAVLVLLVLAVWLQGLVFRKFSFRKLRYTCRFSTSEAMEGDEIALIEEVENRGLLPLPWLKAELTSSRWLEFADSQSLVTEETRFVPSFFMMKPHHKVTRRWKVRCLKRGIYDLKKVVLVTTDLLGGCSPSQMVDVNARLTVLPAPADLTLDFRTPKHMIGDVIVRRHLLFDPFLIAGVRAYTPGDTMNRIHWLATARQGELMVHNNEYSAGQSLSVILNIQSRPYEKDGVIDKDKIEDAIRLAAGYFDSTLRTGIPVRFLCNAGPLHSREAVVTEEYHGREHVNELMRRLAALPLSSTENFPTFLGTTCRDINSSDIVILTCYANADIFAYATQKQAMGSSVRLIHIGSLPDTVTPPDDLPVFTYREEGSYGTSQP